MAYLYQREDGFEPHRITGGHVFCPDPQPGIPGFSELRAMEASAAQGLNVRAFHEAVAANQFEAMQRGSYRHRVGLSREIMTATVDELGCRGGRDPQPGDAVAHVAA